MYSSLIFRNLREGCSLLDELPEATKFPAHQLKLPKEKSELNFSQKLGHLYEDALEAMLEASTRYQILAKSLQLRDETGRTLGELDFLIRDLGSDQIIHLELAIKFYLALKIEEEIYLPGPDSRDNYHRKLQRLRSHQLLLTRDFHQFLPEKFKSDEIEVQHLVQGCIFEKFDASSPITAEFLNPDGRRGKWLHAEDCEAYFGKARPIEIIPKALWPVPLPLLAGIKLELFQPSTPINRCIMVKVPDSEQAHFIVPNDFQTNYQDQLAKRP